MDYQEHVNLVKKFHDKHGFEMGVDLARVKPTTQTNTLLNDANALLIQAHEMLERTNYGAHDARIARAQIHIEETAEMVEALASLNEVELLDALSDNQFITMGTALTFKMPLEEGHLEVCRSNLTKDVRAVNDPRLRDKGPDYKPPQLKEILCAE